MAIQVCPKCGTKNRVDEKAARVKRAVCGKCGTELAATSDGKPQDVTDQTFASEVISASASVPVLVDAWASWCGPCRLIAPAIEQLAAESAGRYKVAKLNVDENQRTAAQYGINSIPTLLLFKDGRLVDRVMGVQPKPQIAAWLAAYL